MLKRSQSGLAQELAFDITELAADISKLTGTFGRAINRKATIVGIATNEAGPVAVRSRGKRPGACRRPIFPAWPTRSTMLV